MKFKPYEYTSNKRYSKIKNLLQKLDYLEEHHLGKWVKLYFEVTIFGRRNPRMLRRYLRHYKPLISHS